MVGVKLVYGNFNNRPSLLPIYLLSCGSFSCIKHYFAFFFYAFKADLHANNTDCFYLTIYINKVITFFCILGLGFISLVCFISIPFLFLFCKLKRYFNIVLWYNIKRNINTCRNISVNLKPDEVGQLASISTRVVIPVTINTLATTMRPDMPAKGSCELFRSVALCLILP